MNDKIDKHNSKGIYSPPCKGGAGGGSAVRIVLHEAIRQEELSHPPMPKDLNARLMKRVEKEVNNKPAKKPLRLIWPWIVAACVAAIIAVNFTPPKSPLTPEGGTSNSLVASKSISQESNDSDGMEQPTFIASVEREPQGKQEKKVLEVKGNETLLAKKEMLLAKVEASEDTSNSSEKVAVGEESVEQEPLLAVAEKPQPQQKPRVLTERDIPITRPENYKYTEEEIALMRRQANEAYLKWVELELEIANHYYEQTAEK